ncbi:hypothetical protein AC1031_007882 [Aphanomyces cochlioides]|nr:hypothetical protein AC1031_007882 [Aphanomyces cochlioides]
MGTNPATKHMKTIRAMFTVTTLTKGQEEEISTWVQNLRRDGIPVSRLFLAAKAHDVAKSAGRSGKTSEADGDVVLQRFSNEIKELILENNIVEIYNADQTAVNYDELLPDKTIDTKGTKHVWIKITRHEKDRMTAMLLADTNGTKNPLFLDLKSAMSKNPAVVVENLEQRHGFGIKIWSEIEELQNRHPSQIYGNLSAWWNSSISIAFLKYHFGYRKGKS